MPRVAYKYCELLICVCFWWERNGRITLMMCCRNDFSSAVSDVMR